jgi:hypothetical protein
MYIYMQFLAYVYFYAFNLHTYLCVNIFFISPFYLQSVPICSLNVAKSYTKARRRVLASTLYKEDKGNKSLAK